MSLIFEYLKAVHQFLESVYWGNIRYPDSVLIFALIEFAIVVHNKVQTLFSLISST